MVGEMGAAAAWRRVFCCCCVGPIVFSFRFDLMYFLAFQRSVYCFVFALSSLGSFRYSMQMNSHQLAIAAPSFVLHKSAYLVSQSNGGGVGGQTEHRTRTGNPGNQLLLDFGLSMQLSQDGLRANP